MFHVPGFIDGLKKSEINNVCAEKQNAVRSRDAFGGKEPALVVVS